MIYDLANIRIPHGISIAAHYVSDCMEQLTQEGFRFYLDVFGVGYSNFTRIICESYT